MLMSASSSGICHQGFPVALPINMYKQYISEIRNKGAVVVSLFGELKIIPSQIGELYFGYTNVPKLYLEVEDIAGPAHTKSRSMEELNVSVAVSFQGTVDRQLGVYATYVTFDPSRPRSFKDAVRWMGDRYVRSYDGRVLTDFDEQENHFPEAKFSLRKVMHLELRKRDFQTIHIERVDQFIAFQEKIEKQANYNVSGGNVGALGDNARAENFRQKATTRPKKRARNAPKRQPKRRGQ